MRLGLEVAGSATLRRPSSQSQHRRERELRDVRRALRLQNARTARAREAHLFASFARSQPDVPRNDVCERWRRYAQWHGGDENDAAQRPRQRSALSETQRAQAARKRERARIRALLAREEQQ